ncbi:hypothetical protein B0H16DRAFT_1882934 [Mycena metata]|uniref:Fucose-specific lectin n=1 Tax=Mycena metata TaxID=1033252 RepID=A0AAD7NLY8_9AGAR|nr:hypothetical protein B0H16DRAFT_1882934 [Mycena metata]
MSDGSIWETAVSNVFFKGGNVIRPDQLIVPASEALLGTPIAAVHNAFTDVHVFFFSRNRVVSEYYWTSGTGWIGGGLCPATPAAGRMCVTTSGFVAATTQFLYAMENTASGAPAKMRVGFNSAGTPGGLTEATMVPTAELGRLRF